MSSRAGGLFHERAFWGEPSGCLPGARGAAAPSGGSTQSRGRAFPVSPYHGMKRTIIDPTLQRRKLRLRHPPSKRPNLPRTAAAVQSGPLRPASGSRCSRGRGRPGPLTVCCASVEDLERNDGSPDRPYYMSKSLLKILGKKNDAPPGDKRKTRQKRP